jgi:hypothetical protein
MQIESILGPLRVLDSLGTIRLSHQYNTFMPPDEWKAWSGLKWQATWNSPVSDWLGDSERNSTPVALRDRLKPLTFLAFLDAVPILSDGHPWSLLEHQFAGHASSHIRMIARRIQPKVDIENAFLKMTRHWCGADNGWLCEPRLSQLIEYRGQLQRLGLDCERYATYRRFADGFYPIDLSQAALDRICAEPFALESIYADPARENAGFPSAILAVIAPSSD